MSNTSIEKYHLRERGENGEWMTKASGRVVLLIKEIES